MHNPFPKIKTPVQHGTEVPWYHPICTAVKRCRSAGIFPRPSRGHTPPLFAAGLRGGLSRERHGRPSSVRTRFLSGQPPSLLASTGILPVTAFFLSSFIIGTSFSFVKSPEPAAKEKSSHPPPPFCAYTATIHLLYGGVSAAFPLEPSKRPAADCCGSF